MGTTGFILLGSGVIAFMYGVLIYNSLVTLKHGLRKAWSNIDVVLKQRHEELPKLVEVCRQYMAYEKATLERVVDARAAVFAARERADPAALGAAEGTLRQGLGALFAVSEAYPELKSDAHFSGLRARISELENAIADRRELYNDAVNLNNARLEQVPDVLVARLFGFKPGTLLEFGAEDTLNPDLRALFRG